MAIENNSINFDTAVIGEVIAIDRLTRKVAVYIPKLMSGIAGVNNISTTISTTSNPNITGTKYSSMIKIRNTIWARSYNQNNSMPVIGSKVMINFVDNSPKNIFWWPFNYDGNYEVIEEERYPKVFDLSVNSKTIEINEEDNIQLNFPDSFEIVVNEEEKTKIIYLNQKQLYVIADSEPDSPFDGLMWFNSIKQRVYIYRNSTFSPLLFDEDLEDIYAVLEATTNRLLFVTATKNILEPVTNQIIGIDPLREGSGFFTYSIIATTGDWSTTVKKDGLYYLSYANKLKEIFTDIEGLVKAYKYSGTKWEELDGFITWTQPGTLGDFESPVSLTLAGAIYTGTAVWTNTDDIKISKIIFDGITISTDTSVTFAFTTTDGLEVGEEFTLINTAGVYSLSPSYYQNAYWDGVNGILTLPDILYAGVETGTLTCNMESSAASTINFGSITITAKERGVE